MCKTFRTSLTKIINKITEQMAEAIIKNDKIEDLKFQLIENIEEVFMLDSETYR